MNGLGSELIVLIVIAVIIVVACIAVRSGKNPNNEISGFKEDIDKTNVSTANSKDKKNNRK